jgi:glycosyltransferase involved in cell wall biosynthesis
VALETLDIDKDLSLERGSIAVCIPVTASLDLLYRCIGSVAAHTSPDVPIVLVDESPADPALERFLSDLGRRITTIRLPAASGPVALAKAGLAKCAHADTVLLSSHALVFEGWLERLSAAGRSNTTVGTASALGNHAGLLSVDEAQGPPPGDAGLERLAAQVAERSPRATPRIPVADGHCVWISRAALDLAGPLDTAFRSLRAAVIDFGERCLLGGLLNVAADDVFVPSASPALSAQADPLSVGEDRPLLERRYPYLARALQEPVSLPMRRSLAGVRTALRTMSITIDARILRGEMSGAQAETLELIEALDRTGRLDVRALLDPAIGPDALAVLERLKRVERLYAGDVSVETERSDVVHRPYQVTSVEDLDLLSQLGERLVITHLDLISFHNPGYLGTFEAWWQYRRLTRQALAMADKVIFLSQHAASDAAHEELVEAGRVQVMPMAVNRDRPEGDPRRPKGAPDGPFLLCIGNDFRHKNRVFAIRLVAALRERGWTGRLVLAGPHIGHGSSRGDEAALLASRPELAGAVVDLPSVTEAEKAWLYKNSAAVVYPTVYEGFGLVPFEAARAGTPCLFAPQASLAEMLPAEAAVLVPWDADVSAERALPLLDEGDERRRHLELVAAAAASMDDWESIGRKLLDTYRQVTLSPFREAASLAAEARLRERELSKWVALEENMGDLVGPDAYLPPDVQRALLAVSTRRGLRGAVFALLRALYRLGYRARRVGRVQ